MRYILLIALCTVLWTLESLWPLRRYQAWRLRRAVPNLMLTAILLAMNAVVAGSLRLAAGTSSGWHLYLIGVVALDLCGYVAHVLLHKWSLGWRFHRVHHSENEVDVTTAFRQHPGETLWRIAWQLPAIVVLRLPFEVVALYSSLSALNALFEHANIRVPARLDRLARLLLVTPDMHKVHHSRLQPETDSNYANIFSIWDRLFGTYTSRGDLNALRYGLDGFDDADRVRALLALPFRSAAAKPPLSQRR